MTPDPPAILVADDEPQLLRVLIRVLEKHGHPVVPAKTGDEAQRLFQASPDEINVVVLDAAIDPHGSEVVLEQVVKLRPHVGVVVTSGDALTDAMRELMLDNDGIFLRKPFPPRALLRAVEDSLIKGDSLRPLLLTTRLACVQESEGRPDTALRIDQPWTLGRWPNSSNQRAMWV